MTSRATLAAQWGRLPSEIRSTATKSSAPAQTSTAKLVFLDSTNLGVGPVSRVTLDQFVYVGESNGQKMAVNLAKGVFRFTTGELDKNAYMISTPTAAIGVRGHGARHRRAERADRALRWLRDRRSSVPAGPGSRSRSRIRDCARAAGGAQDRAAIASISTNVGQTAQVKKTGGANQASLTSTPVNFASLCAGDSSLCSDSSYASADQTGGFASGVLCGR